MWTNQSSQIVQIHSDLWNVEATIVDGEKTKLMRLGFDHEPTEQEQTDAITNGMTSVNEEDLTS